MFPDVMHCHVCLGRRKGLCLGCSVFRLILSQAQHQRTAPDSIASPRPSGPSKQLLEWAQQIEKDLHRTFPGQPDVATQAPRPATSTWPRMMLSCMVPCQAKEQEQQIDHNAPACGQPRHP